MNIVIKHKDGSMFRVNISKSVHGYADVKTSVYGSDGYYKAGASWSDNLPIEDIERQVQAAYKSGSHVEQHTDSGKVIDFHRLVFA